MKPPSQKAPHKPQHLHLFPLRLSPLHRRPKLSRPTVNFSQTSNRLQRPSRPSNRRLRLSNRLPRPSNQQMIKINQRGSRERSSGRASRENESRLSAIELDWKKCTKSTASRAMTTKKARRSTKTKSKNIVAQSMPLERREVIRRDGFSSITRDGIDV